jgi:hypothetical protein
MLSPESDRGTLVGTSFMVYIEDLETEIESGRLDVLVKKFADDT